MQQTFSVSNKMYMHYEHAFYIGQFNAAMNQLQTRLAEVANIQEGSLEFRYNLNLISAWISMSVVAKTFSKSNPSKSYSAKIRLGKNWFCRMYKRYRQKKAYKPLVARTFVYCATLWAYWNMEPSIWVTMLVVMPASFLLLQHSIFQIWKSFASFLDYGTVLDDSV